LGIQGNNADLSLCLPRLHTEGIEILLHSFLTLALDGGDWTLLLLFLGRKSLEAIE
jgi:hypothetical protein